MSRRPSGAGSRSYSGHAASPEPPRERCYYEILNVSRTATPTEIRKSYRRLALQLHPDKPTGDEEKFKEVAAAYEVLSDESKRRTYDRYGREGLQGGAGRSGPGGFGPGFHFTDPFELFREFFGAGSPFEDPFFSQGPFGGGPRRSGSGGRQSDPFGSPFGDSPFGGSAFGGSLFSSMMADPFGDSFGGGGMMQSFSSSSGGGRGSFSSRSSSTVISNGRRVTRESITENGVTTEKVTEADARTGEVLKLTVNGQDQPVSGYLK
eukprot:m.467033 g.467033  ORF g.467033 m.467033 type:complete len:264 (-) comp25822_c0_seq1:154-945(-)